MKKKWFQISLKGLLILALVIAAYLAGRTPWERAAKLNHSQTLARERERDQTSLYASVWREIALEYRDDIRMSGIYWRMKSSKGRGRGWSIVGGPNDEEIRPRVKRWQITFSDEPDIVKKQLDVLQALIVGVWDNPQRMEQWDSELGRFREIGQNEKLERWLIMAAGNEVFNVLPDTVFTDRPRFILIAIPESGIIQLARLEFQRIQKAKINLKDIDSTTYGFGPSGKLLLLQQTLKTTPK